MKTLILVTLCIGCTGTIGQQGDIGDDDMLVSADEDLASTSAALSGSVPVGSTLQTTANLNLRSGAGTGYAIRLVIPSGATVTTVAAAPSGGFYNLKYNGTTGWSSGTY